VGQPTSNLVTIVTRSDRIAAPTEEMPRCITPACTALQPPVIQYRQKNSAAKTRRRQVDVHAYLRMGVTLKRWPLRGRGPRRPGSHEQSLLPVVMGKLGFVLVVSCHSQKIVPLDLEPAGHSSEATVRCSPSDGRGPRRRRPGLPASDLLSTEWKVAPIPAGASVSVGGAADMLSDVASMISTVYRNCHWFMS